MLRRYYHIYLRVRLVHGFRSRKGNNARASRRHPASDPHLRLLREPLVGALATDSLYAFVRHSQFATRGALQPEEAGLIAETALESRAGRKKRPRQR